MPKIILGITGTIGSGKSTVANYLVQKYGFLSRFGSDILKEKIAGLGLPLTRENYQAMADENRRKGGSLLQEDEVFNRIIRPDDPRAAVVGFFRNSREVERFKALLNSYLIAVDAPTELRYSRITERGSSKDKVSFEEFAEQSNRELHGANPWEPEVEACMAQADFRIRNDSSKEDLYGKIEAILKQAGFTRQNGNIR